MQSFKYKVRFESVAHCILNDDDDKYLAKASLDKLKDLLPKDIPWDSTPDVIGFVGNGAIINRANKNSHALTYENAVEFAKSLKWKFLDVEHSRSTIVGVITNAGFSKLGTDELMTEEEAATTKEPYQLSICGLIWRVARPSFTKKVVESSDPDSEWYQKISLSWEVGFSNIQLLVGSRNLLDGEWIKDEAKVQELEKYLRSSGGDGKLPDGRPVYTIIAGENIVPLGFGFVANPAADVKGILTLDTDEDEEREDDDAAARLAKVDEQFKVSSEALIEAFVQVGQSATDAAVTIDELAATVTSTSATNVTITYTPEAAPVEKIAPAAAPLEIAASTSENLTQNHASETVAAQNNTSHKNDPRVNKAHMKITSQAELIAALKEVKASEEVVASSVEYINQALKDANDKYVAEKTAKENAVNEVKADAEKTKTELAAAKEQIKTLAADLNKLNDQAAAEKQEAAFQARMNALNAEYELDAEDNAAIAKANIKAMDDASFETWYNSFKTFARAKSKAAIAAAKKPATEVKASTDTAAVVGDALKNATVVSAAIPNATTPQTSLKDKYKNLTVKDHVEYKR